MLQSWISIVMREECKALNVDKSAITMSMSSALVVNAPPPSEPNKHHLLLRFPPSSHRQPSCLYSSSLSHSSLSPNRHLSPHSSLSPNLQLQLTMVTSHPPHLILHAFLKQQLLSYVNYSLTSAPFTDFVPPLELDDFFKSPHFFVLLLRFRDDILYIKWLLICMVQIKTIK